MTLPIDWPPTLETYKTDLKLAADDDRFDDALQYGLDAAVAYVERVREDVNFLGESGWDGPEVTADLILGTLRYARRLDVRRDTPVGTFLAGTLGSATIMSLDADIDRLLRVGRHALTRFA